MRWKEILHWALLLVKTCIEFVLEVANQEMDWFLFSCGSTVSLCTCVYLFLLIWQRQKNEYCCYSCVKWLIFLFGRHFRGTTVRFWHWFVFNVAAFVATTLFMTFKDTFGTPMFKPATTLRFILTIISEEFTQKENSVWPSNGRLDNNNYANC